MLLTWMAYATLIGALVTAGAFALDALALRRGLPTRFIWLSALLVVIAAPMLVERRESRPASRPHTAESAPAVRTSASSGQVTLGSPQRGVQFRVRALVFLLEIDRYVGRAWFAASILYALVLLRAAIALRRRRREWQSTDVDGQRVLVSADTGPAVVGVVRARIVLPQWVLSMDRSARAVVLRHEIEHVTARDPIVLAAARFATALIPWNAAVWAIVRRLRLAIEIDCDRRVVGAIGDPAAYGELLLTVGARRRTRFVFVASLAERHRFLEHRIKALSPSISRHPRLAAVSLIVVALIASTAAIRAPRPGPISRAAASSDSLTIDELRALLTAHQPDALVAASGVNTVTVLLDARGNYVTSLAETRTVTAGGRGGRGGSQVMISAGELSTRDAGGIMLSDGQRGGAPGGRARGNVRNGFSPDSFPEPPARITTSNERTTINPATGQAEKTVRVSSLSMIDGDTVLLSFRESTGEVGFVKHVYITLDGPIGAGAIFGFQENVLGNLVPIQQVSAVHAHAYAAGEVGEQRLNVFVVRLKP